MRRPVKDATQKPARKSQEREEEIFQRGMDQFNSRRFFEAHESWEEIWLGAPEPDKTFLQGIIQVSAAFHHYSRGNLSGTKSLLKAGLRKLERFPDAYRGLRVEDLRKAARRWIEALAARKDCADDPRPRLKWL